MAEELLSCREHLAYLARDGILDLFFPHILHAVDFQRPDLFDVPSLAQIGFTDLPEFDKNEAPEAVDDGKGDGVGAEVVPTKDTPDGGKDEKAGVTMDKGEVEGDLTSQLYPFLMLSMSKLPFHQKWPEWHPNRRHST